MTRGIPANVAVAVVEISAKTRETSLATLTVETDATEIVRATALEKPVVAFEAAATILHVWRDRLSQNFDADFR